MRFLAQLALGLPLAAALACDGGAESQPAPDADIPDGARVVSTAGSDDSSGHAGAPWRTLQHAAHSVGPGDVVVVMPGEYRGFQLSISGTEDAPIVFRAAGEVEVRGEEVQSGSAISMQGASHVVIEGFRIGGASGAGISATACQDVVIRDNQIRDNGMWGIFTSHCDDVVIEDNEVSRARNQHGIYVSNNGDRPVIRRNHVYQNSRAGIHMNGDADAGGDGMISGAVVTGNVLHDNGAAGAAAINGDGVEDSVFANNVIYDNLASGIALFRIDGARGSTGNWVVGNTIVMPSSSRWGVLLEDGSTGTRIFNNVILNADPGKGAIAVSADSLAGLDSDFNVVENRLAESGDVGLTLEEWQTRTGQDGSSLLATAGELFRDPGDGDFALRDVSPAIDAGRQTPHSSEDIDGRLRPQGAGIDIGAYERNQDG